MCKLTFDQALELIAEQRHASRGNVQAAALRRKVWQMLYCAPGCMPDHSSVSLTKEAAIREACDLYADDAPRGMLTALRRHGIAPCDAQGYYRVTIERIRLSDLF